MSGVLAVAVRNMKPESRPTIPQGQSKLGYFQAVVQTRMMKALLNNERAPVTYGVGFIETPFARYCEAFTSWWKRLEIEFETLAFEAELKESLLHLEPLQNPQNRYLITETQSSWTAIFSNSRGGSDVTSAVRHLCKVLACKGVEIQCAPSRTRCKGIKHPIHLYGATSFTLVGPYETDWLNQIRHISARNDGGRWVFHTQGKVQPFEKVESYSNKRIQDRFTPEMLESYCAAIGIRVFDAEFYGPKGFLVHQLTKFPSTSPRMTFEEARARLYLEERSSDK